MPMWTAVSYTHLLVPSEQMALSYISKKYLAQLRVAIVEITEIEYEINFILPEEARTLKLNTKPAKEMCIRDRVHAVPSHSHQA